MLFICLRRAAWIRICSRRVDGSADGRNQLGMTMGGRGILNHESCIVMSDLVFGFGADETGRDAGEDTDGKLMCAAFQVCS